MNMNHDASQTQASSRHISDLEVVKQPRAERRARQRRQRGHAHLRVVGGWPFARLAVCWLVGGFVGGAGVSLPPWCGESLRAQPGQAPVPLGLLSSSTAVAPALSPSCPSLGHRIVCMNASMHDSALVPSHRLQRRLHALRTQQCREVGGGVQQSCELRVKGLGLTGERVGRAGCERPSTARAVPEARRTGSAQPWRRHETSSHCHHSTLIKHAASSSRHTRWKGRRCMASCRCRGSSTVPVWRRCA
jgi:hypothetical protein